MNEFLHDVLPKHTWRNKLRRDGSFAFLEFSPLDIDRLSRLGITVDKLGPHIVVCMWDEKSTLEIGGYLVVDNLAMGSPSMGGIRMLPDITPKTIHNLARGMTLKNAAADLPYGGGKAGIVDPGGLSASEHKRVIQGFANLLLRYHSIYLPGPDVGTNDSDMKTIAIENGLDYALSKPAEMGGNRIDQLGAAAEGTVIAIDALLSEMKRLKVLPQFSNLNVPKRSDLTVLIQGFGAVGAHVARILTENTKYGKAPRVTGVSDAAGYLYDSEGLQIRDLFKFKNTQGIVTLPYYTKWLEKADSENINTKFSNAPNDLLRESAFCFVPAAPIACYLDVDTLTKPSITVKQMGKWSMIVESANTYSPDPERKAARARMERVVYWQAGVLIATDYLVNSGGVIYAAQEKSIPTPEKLLVPKRIRGNRRAVDQWLKEHKSEFEILAEKRKKEGEKKVRKVISQNMRELVDILVKDPDMLPCEAAEKISIYRMTSKERYQTVADVMSPIPVISVDKTMRDAAYMLIEENSDILAVISPKGTLSGVITDWDVTRASATACAEELYLEEMMTKDVVTAQKTDSVLSVIRKLEHFEISAIPVVDEEKVSGVVSSDLLARRSLYRMLQTQD